jgi:uncharacterized protein (DUF169 family)
MTASAVPELSVFEGFEFERPPVGLKFSRLRPEGVEPVGRPIALCETLAEAQTGRSFCYAATDEICAGGMPLGNAVIEPPFAGGEIGPLLEVFKEARANRRIYQVLPKLDPGTARFITFAPLDKLTFDPDVLVVTARVSQAEVILRASSWTTGRPYVSRSTPVIGCAWLYVYPFVSGELNFSVTGLCWGMKALRVFPEGLVLLSIPFDLLPMITANLAEMPWVPPSYTDGRDGYVARFQSVEKSLLSS